MSKKTIFLIVNQGFTARYILRSEIFTILKNSGANIVILSQSSDESYFRDEFKGDNIFHEKYEPGKYRDKNSKIVLFFTLARLYSFKVSNNFTDHWRNHYLSLRNNISIINKINDWILFLAIKLLSQSKNIRKLFINIESTLTRNVHKRLFDKYQPDMVVTTSLGMLPYDRFIMQEAKKYGAKVVSLILSWDNTTTKGIAGAKADYVVAWTETMKKELVDYHDISPDNIFVGGVVQYDEYFKDKNLYSREYLFEMLGLDISKKTIFYCIESPTAYKWNPQLINILGKMMKEGQVSATCQLVIRPHPIYFRILNGKYVYEKDINQLKELEKKYPFIVFDYPEALSEHTSHDMPKSETYKLGALLKYSDIVMCFYSSINIEASIFNTPIINIELYHKKNLPNKVMANHAHNKRVFATGGVKSVTDEASLLKGINDYLSEPSRDSDGRRNIVEQEAGPNQGVAAKTIGNYLVDLLNEIR